MINGIRIEICCGSINDVMTASSFAEVDRIELNCALELGGLTPSLSTLKAARQCSDKKIIAMVRTRTAGFCYSPQELEIMYRDAELFLQNGADGIVFGFLNADGTVDEYQTERMVRMIHSYGREAVFHKAFDAAKDPFQTMETLIGCGIERVLTSGREESVTAGIPLLKQLQSRCGNAIEILPGGGVSAANAVQVIRETGCTQLHMSAKTVRHDLEDYLAVDPQRISDVLSVLS